MSELEKGSVPSNLGVIASQPQEQLSELQGEITRLRLENFELRSEQVGEFSEKAKSIISFLERELAKARAESTALRDERETCIKLLSIVGPPQATLTEAVTKLREALGNSRQYVLWMTEERAKLNRRVNMLEVGLTNTVDELRILKAQPGTVSFYGKMLERGNNE